MELELLVTLEEPCSCIALLLVDSGSLLLVALEAGTLFCCDAFVVEWLELVIERLLLF